MTATMRTEAREHPNNLKEIVNFTIAGTTFYYGPKEGGVFRVTANGRLYVPGMISRSTIPRKLSWPSYGLFEPRVTFRIYDEDRSLQKHLGGPAQGAVIGGTFSYAWSSPNITSANVFTIINAGIIKDFRYVGDRIYEFVVGPDDAPLKDKLKIPILSRAIWSNIPVANEDAAGKIYFGNWISTGVPGATGMVPATLVDEVTGIWLVSYGIMDHVTNINVDGVSDTDFTVVGTGTVGVGPFVHNGRPYTILQDDAGTLRTTSNSVTCDVLGPEQQGDGSQTGLTLEDAATMLRIILANFCYNEYPIDAPTPTAGSWSFFSQETADANTPINVDSNDDADSNFFNPYNVSASILATSDDTGIDIIKTWAKSFRCPVGWDIPFELVTRPIKLNNRDAYPTEVITKVLNEITKAEGQTKGTDVVTAHKTTYIFNASTGSFVNVREDGNRFCNDRKKEDYEFTYGPAEAV